MDVSEIPDQTKYKVGESGKMVTWSKQSWSWVRQSAILLAILVAVVVMLNSFLETAKIVIPPHRHHRHHRHLRLHATPSCSSTLLVVRQLFFSYLLAKKVFSAELQFLKS